MDASILMDFGLFSWWSHLWDVYTAAMSFASGLPGVLAFLCWVAFSVAFLVGAIVAPIVFLGWVIVLAVKAAMFASMAALLYFVATDVGHVIQEKELDRAAVVYQQNNSAEISLEDARKAVIAKRDDDARKKLEAEKAHYADWNLRAEKTFREKRLAGLENYRAVAGEVPDDQLAMWTTKTDRSTFDGRKWSWIPGRELTDVNGRVLDPETLQ